METLKSHCELCGNTKEFKPYYPTHQIAQCSSCELVFYSAMMPSSSIYTKEYFHGGEYLDYLADKQIHQKNFGTRIQDLKKYAPKGKLLEIGSAYGFFLELAKKHWDTCGIEVVPEAVEYAKTQLGLNVQLGDFLEFGVDSDKYDIICMWDTIEHLPHPMRFIEKASHMLNPGGILVMTTGDIESKVAKMRKEKWRQIHPPTHLYYFSPKTLGQAAKRAGLEVQEVRHVGYYRSLKAILFGIFAVGGKKTSWLYNLLTLNGRLDFPIYLNIYDIMMVIAQKPTEPQQTN